MISPGASDHPVAFDQRPAAATDPAQRLPEPRDRLDPKAVTLWRISGLTQAVIVSALVVALLIGLRIPLDFSWWWVVLAGVVVAALTVTLALAVPVLMWRRWRYEIHEDEADLQHGVFTVIRQLVPMARIQHVDTRRGPLQRRFGLASVVLFTAAGAIEIPALADEVAANLRDRIATLANVHDDL
jgi:uncharacterized protein